MKTFLGMLICIGVLSASTTSFSITTPHAHFYSATLANSTYTRVYTRVDTGWYYDGDKKYVGRNIHNVIYTPMMDVWWVSMTVEKSTTNGGHKCSPFYSIDWDYRYYFLWKGIVPLWIAEINPRWTRNWQSGSYPYYRYYKSDHNYPIGKPLPFDWGYELKADWKNTSTDSWQSSRLDFILDSGQVY